MPEGEKPEIIIATKRGGETPRPVVVLFSDIHKEIKSKDTPPDKLQELQQEMQARVKNMEELDIVKWSNIRARVLTEIKENEWDHVYNKLLKLAADLENEARGINRGLPEREKYDGIVQAAVEMAALEVSVQGMQRRKGDPDFKQWIQEHGKTPEELEDDTEIVGRARILDFRGIDLPDLVGETLEERRELERQAMGIADMGRTEELLEAQAVYQERQVELLEEGYNGVVQTVRERGRANPEIFDQRPPPWYKDLSEREQGVIRIMLHISYFAAQKRDFGMIDLDAVLDIKGLRFETKNLQTMWETMPGYRIALATMINDLFEKDRKVFEDKKEKVHFRISGVNKEEEKTGGYKHLSSQERFDKYKADLIKKIEKYFEEKIKKGESEELLATVEKYRVPLEDLATAAVATADNLLFATGAYESGEDDRRTIQGAANLCSDAVRTFFAPGVKGWRHRWFVGRGKKEPGVAERQYAGPLGAWIAENASATEEGRDDFRDRYDKGEFKLIPHRMMYSMLDQSDFQKGTDHWREEGRSMAQVLLETETGVVETKAGDLIDYVNDGKGIKWTELRADEIVGEYFDLADDVKKVYRHLTSGDERNNLSIGRFLDSVIKIRGESKLLNELYRDENLMTAGVIMAISPTGLKKGITEMVLDLDESSYDYLVDYATADDRLYEGMEEPGFRERLLERLHAEDLQTLEGTIVSFFVTETALIGRRKRLRRKALSNLQSKREGK